MSLPVQVPLPRRLRRGTRRCRRRHLARAMALALGVVTVTAAPVSAVQTWVSGRAPSATSYPLASVPVASVAGSGPATAAPSGNGDRVRADAATDAVFDVPATGSAIGVTWATDDSPSEGQTLWVRTHSRGGWSSWAELSFTALTDPAQTAGMRVGTDPVYAPGTDRVQVRVPADQQAVARRARVDAVDAGSAPVLQGARADTLALPVITRAQWGADESIRRCGPSYSDGNVAMVVHHTADTNNYSAADSPAIVRSIYAYHVLSMGWCDIGYNMLVDKYGQVFEGRYGGLDRPVWGAHALGFNENTFGVSVMGNYMTTAVSSAARTALTNVLTRRAYAFGIDPQAQARLVTGADGTRFPTGTEVTMPTIFGHRDVNYTSCPGDQLYSLLPSVRSAVAAKLASFAPNYRKGAYNLDVDGDERGDLVGLAAGSDSLSLMAGQPDGTFGVPQAVGSGWSGYTRLVATGDINFDGTPDVLADGPGGRLDLNYLNPNGTLYFSRPVGSGFTNIGLLTSGGSQLGRSGQPYLYGRTWNGELWAYFGDGWGGFTGQTRVGTGWGGIDQLIGGRDLDGDGVADLVARQASTGDLLLYRGRGDGRINEGVRIGTGWNGFTDLHLVYSRADGPAIVGRTPDGKLLRYALDRMSPTFLGMTSSPASFGTLSALW